MCKHLLTSSLLILAGIVAGCEKDEDDNPPQQGGGTTDYGPGNGAVTFYMTASAPYVMNSLTLGGTILGGFNQYVSAGQPVCGSSTSGLVISAVRAAGTYTWCATRDNGSTYTGSVIIPNGSCILRGIGSSDLGSCSGSPGCNWQLNPSYVNVQAVMSDMCGEPNGGITLTMTNQSSQPIKIGVCIQLNSGNWYSTSDGTFDSGVAPGQSVNAWNCYATGQWKIHVMPLSTYLANSCGYPSCN